MSKDKIESGSSVAQAIGLALTKINTAELPSLASAGGACFRAGDNSIELTYLGGSYRVSFPDGKAHGSPELSELESALILHYLIQATGRKPTGRLISFGDINPSASFIAVATADSRLGELAAAFGDNPQKLYDVLDRLPGGRSTQGDASIRLDILPRLSFTFVIWAGEDDIIPPAASLLFDSTAADYLPPADIGVLAGLVAGRILEIAAG